MLLSFRQTPGSAAHEYDGSERMRRERFRFDETSFSPLDRAKVTCAGKVRSVLRETRVYLTRTSTEVKFRLPIR